MMAEDGDSNTVGHYGYHGHHHHGSDPTVGTHDVRDAVCGVMLDPHMTEHMSRRGNEIFYFHSAACKASFDAAPERYSG